jgi:hypothetical protein
VESGWVWRNGGGVREVVRKLCEFVEDEWELVRQMWGFRGVAGRLCLAQFEAVCNGLDVA